MKAAPAGPFLGSATLNVDYYEDGIIRLRTFDGPSLSEEVGLMDFGPSTPAVWSRSATTWSAQEGNLRLSFEKSSGGFSLTSGEWSLSGTIRTLPFRAEFDLRTDEAVFGFGFQRTALDCRGHQLSWRRVYRSHSATVPFFFTTGGYGFFSNNSHAHEFDCGATDPGRMKIRSDGGDLDFFVIPGPSPRKILNGYTRLCGRPELPPKWALGLHYIARYFETQEGLLEIAERFRKEGIPCDILGVEPGWEKHPYSMDWEWCPERFPDPAGMIKDLSNKGFRFELWESGDAPMSGYLDSEERRDWYARRISASLDIGVACFKQDDPYPRMIKSTEMNEAEFKGVLGDSAKYSAAEAGELSNPLYSMTSHSEFERLTGGERALTIFHSYVTGPGGHRWPVAWAGDFPNGPGMLNAGLSGHSMVAIDMKAEGAAGIHFGYLTPYALIDSWAFFQDPWLLPPHLSAMHRFYGRLRSRLRPYLYSALWQSALEGIPLMRAMALEHPTDRELRSLTTQHYLGDWLLVGQAGSADGASDDERFVQSDEVGLVKLPPGQWWDYWSGTPVDANRACFEYHAAHPMGGPLLVKAGAIIPMTTCDPCETDSPSKLLRLDIFPASTETRTSIYDDDGKAKPMERGQWTVCDVVCSPSEDLITIRVSRFEGESYQGPARAWLLSLHLTRCPEKVLVGDWAMPTVDSLGSLLQGGEPGCFWDGARGVCWLRVQGGWNLVMAKDPEVPEYDRFDWPGEPDMFSPGGFVVSILLGNARVNMSPAILETVSKPDRLHILANPPERVALEGGGWLPMKTTIWVSLFEGPRACKKSGVVVRLASTHSGTVLREETALTDSNGVVAFAGWDYVPGATLFEASSSGLKSVSLQVGKARLIRGLMR